MQFLLPLLMLFAFSCNSALKPDVTTTVAKGTIDGVLEHNEFERSYVLYVPESYDPGTATPLVFNFHGYTSNARDQMAYGDFRPIAEREGFIVVHPQGEKLAGKTHWNVGGWTLESEMDDVDFTLNLLEEIKASYHIDEQRVYSTGMSNGGYMSFLLACQLSDKFAAVASVTGSMTPQIYSNCNPTHPTPVLQIHGTSDDTVPYEGNPLWTHSIEEVINYWVAFNGCDAEATVLPFEDTPFEDDSTVEFHRYDGGNAGATVEHYKVYNGGHTWPGALEGLPKTNYDIEATELIWRFFKQYDLDGRLE